MQTVIVKDKNNLTIGRVIISGFIELKNIDDLTSYLMDKGHSIEPDRILTESSPTD